MPNTHSYTVEKPLTFSAGHEKTQRSRWCPERKKSFYDAQISVDLSDPQTVAKEFCRDFVRGTSVIASGETIGCNLDTAQRFEEISDKVILGPDTKYDVIGAVKSSFADAATGILQAAVDGLMKSDKILATALAYKADLPLTDEQKLIMAESPRAIMVHRGKGGATPLFPSDFVATRGCDTASITYDHGTATGKGRGDVMRKNAITAHFNAGFTN